VGIYHHKQPSVFSFLDISSGAFAVSELNSLKPCKSELQTPASARDFVSAKLSFLRLLLEGLLRILAQGDGLGCFEPIRATGDYQPIARVRT